MSFNGEDGVLPMTENSVPRLLDCLSDIAEAITQHSNAIAGLVRRYVSVRRALWARGHRCFPWLYESHMEWEETMETATTTVEMVPHQDVLWSKRQDGDLE